VLDGRIVWSRQATGAAWHKGTFKHWLIHAGSDAELDRYLASWVSKHMHGYTGMLNFEAIGGRIIEVHLRFADQWPDLYGPGWVEALIGLYAKGCWTFADGARCDGYSLPLFARHGCRFRHPSIVQQEEIRALPGVTSLQITFHESKDADHHAMPPGGFRLGIVNCTDLAAGQAARRRLAQCFPEADIMLPED
jgi:hypothetical protein